MNKDNLNESRKKLFSWICFVYASIIVAIGVSLPLTLGVELVESPRGFDEYIDFYSVLYSMGLVFLLLHYLATETHVKIWNHGKKRFAALSKCCKFNKSKSSVSPVDSNHVLNIKITLNNNEYELNEEKGENNGKISTGRLGLKFGVKVSFVVLLIMLLMELSAFVKIKIQDYYCDYENKIANIVIFIVYVMLQTWFILETKQEDLDKHWLLNHLCAAHLAATTICIGTFMTTQDCLLKMIYLAFKLLEEEKEDKREFKSALPQWIGKSQGQENEADLNATLNDSDPCSLEHYISEMNQQIKPFSYHFTMMYVYCCTILFILLFMHLRKQVYKSNSKARFFKAVSSKSATFSSGAGVTLIIVSFVTAILTIHASTNAFVAVFLLVLHGQATVVAVIALFKISELPCTIRKDVSKHGVIFLIFYFFNVVISVFQAITEINEMVDYPDYVLILQFFVEILDIIQAFLHGLLILIGFYTIIEPHVLHQVEMPTEILIHLAATNAASLISSVFVSQSKLKKLETWFQYSDTYADTTATIAWTVFDSILSPAEEFEKLFTIICLLKLHKIWTSSVLKRSSSAASQF